MFVCDSPVTHCCVSCHVRLYFWYNYIWLIPRSHSLMLLNLMFFYYAKSYAYAHYFMNIGRHWPSYYIHYERQCLAYLLHSSSLLHSILFVQFYFQFQFICINLHLCITVLSWIIVLLHFLCARKGKEMLIWNKLQFCCWPLDGTLRHVYTYSNPICS